MINLDELLFQAYTLGIDTEDKSAAFSKAQLRSVLFRSVPLLGKIESDGEKSDDEKSESDKPAKPTKKLTKTKAEKTEGEEKKTRKPRATAKDEIRCHARTFNEKEHLENGKPKIMNPDDEDNLYGGRCSSKKYGNDDFCKMHGEKQPHGIWDGAYGDKCKKHLDEAETAEPAEPKKVLKKKAPKIEEHKDAAEEHEDDAGEHADDEYISSVNKLEAAKISYEWIEIDGEDFMIADNGDVHDPETELLIGNFNAKTKKWNSGGPKADE